MVAAGQHQPQFPVFLDGNSDDLGCAAAGKRHHVVQMQQSRCPDR